MMVGTAIGLVVMMLLYLMAKKYLERDWQRKMQQARANRIRPAAEAKPAEDPRPQGSPYELPPGATRRHLRRLASDRIVPNGWLVLGRSLSDRDSPKLVIGSLRMAMAIGGETATINNDLGAAYLQQRRLRSAAAQFQAALQIEPGFPPALYNLALCAVADRQPVQATSLLARYLARRPLDTAAYRLQSTLLSQLGRSDEALQLLERMLKDQPPSHPLFLEAALLAARLGHHGNAIRYLETAQNGNPIQSVVRAYQSPAFRDIRLSSDGPPLAARLASRARMAYGAPLPPEEIQPLRANPGNDAILR